MLAHRYDVQSEDKKRSSPNLEASNLNEEYFFPAILKTADISSLKCDASGEEISPEPLCIKFDTGYMPEGQGILVCQFVFCVG